MATVSVALATYNGARFLPQQLQSLLDQELRPSELVVCDDASSDRTESIIKDFARRAPFPVRLHINERRMGYRANFMKAAGYCTGDIIAFSDQDDVWSPRKLAASIAPFAEADVLLTYHNARLVDEAGSPLGAVYRDRERAWLRTPWHFPLGFSQTFRRVLLDFDEFRADSIDWNNPQEPMAHDQWIAFLASALGRVFYVDALLVDYRQHEANTFGVVRSGPTSVVRSLWHKLTRIPSYGTLARVCNANARILGRVTTKEQAQRQRLRIVRRFYIRLARLYSQREDAFSDPSTGCRLRAWLSLVNQGSYRRGPLGGFPHDELVRDLIVGVCGVRLKRYDPSILWPDLGLYAPPWLCDSLKS